MLNNTYINFSGTSGEDLLQEFGCQKTIEKCQEFHLNIQETMLERQQQIIILALIVTFLRIFQEEFFGRWKFYQNNKVAINKIYDIVLFGLWLFTLGYIFLL